MSAILCHPEGTRGPVNTGLLDLGRECSKKSREKTNPIEEQTGGIKYNLLIPASCNQRISPSNSIFYLTEEWSTSSTKSCVSQAADWNPTLIQRDQGPGYAVSLYTWEPMTQCRTQTRSNGDLLLRKRGRIKFGSSRTQSCRLLKKWTVRNAKEPHESSPRLSTTEARLTPRPLLTNSTRS